MSEHDPHSRFEDEGIPDLQDGTPGQQLAVDPQEAPLPADRPVAVDDFGTTVEEQIQGEPLEGRLRREVPEEEPVFGVAEPPRPASDATGGAEVSDVDADPEGYGAGTGEDAENGLGVGADLDTGPQPDDDVADGWAAQPEEPSGTVWDDPRPAGRLVDPDEGVRTDTEPDLVAREVGPDGGGYTAEEAAMRVEPE
ncbi:hypothetical protein Sru01_58640 [Sphaerisporangium rufum]|uniref:DUF5709 domain-containing protein n=1 Tax=Sphaerisporangium rufum TaxID=1381558 RepID=A0A919R724_9ACTN|nr:DUF5709 domain-containing protein [Sphaerisporangium rufum]GII80882.1 hypothetical protein Sru01_58640 [Sphaerisporangium rufum]